MEDAGSSSRDGGVTVGYKPIKLAATLYWNDSQRSNIGIRNRMERAEGLESGDAEATEPGTSKMHWSSLWVFGRKDGKSGRGRASRHDSR